MRELSSLSTSNKKCKKRFIHVKLCSMRSFSYFFNFDSGRVRKFLVQ